MVKVFRGLRKFSDAHNSRMRRFTPAKHVLSLVEGAPRAPSRKTSSVILGGCEGLKRFLPEFLLSLPKGSKWDMTAPLRPLRHYCSGHALRPFDFALSQDMLCGRYIPKFGCGSAALGP